MDIEFEYANVAIAHDYLVQAGGAERVVASLHDVFPRAPIHTSVYDPDGTFECFRNMDIRTSFLQGSPLSRKRFHKLGLFLYASAFEAFDFSKYDLVISSSSSFAKGIITKPETCHVDYCHTPTRFAWQQQSYFETSGANGNAGSLASHFMGIIRSWDLQAAMRPDYIVANSYNVARRIRTYYRRDVDAVIHPPVETSRLRMVSSEQVGDHFLVVSRLLKYKRIDLAVEACNRLQRKLRVVGVGPELAALKKLAGPTITFCGRLTDEQVTHELATCKALIFPGDEDFGITPLEAMASGRPVVAYGAGGALETVRDGQTGLLFRDQSVDSLCDALVRVAEIRFNPEALEAYARKFDTLEFHAAMKGFLRHALEDHRRRNTESHIRSAGSYWRHERLFREPTQV
ncbi:MAG: glycosyltransferase [Capsulimonadaceae bacterium]